MFTRETRDWLVVITRLLMGAVLLVPIILLYLKLKEAGIANDSTTHMSLLIAGILLVVGYLGFTAGAVESLMDHETMYYVVMYGSLGAWLIGTVMGVMPLLTDSKAFLSGTYEFANSAEKWFVTVSAATLSISGFALISFFLRTFSWMHNGIANIVDFACFVLLGGLTIIFFTSSLFGALQVIIYISLIPFVIEIISIVVEYIKNRN